MKVVKIVTLVAAIAAAAIAFGAPKMIRRFTHSFGEAALVELQKSMDGDQRPLVESGERPFRTGKVVLINPEMWQEVRQGGTTVSVTEVNASTRGRIGARLSPPEVDGQHFDLDDDVRADSPDEVETIIFCERKHLLAKGLIVLDADTGDVVTTVPPADARAINLTIVDKKSHTLIARCSVLEKSSGTMNDFVKKLAVRAVDDGPK